METFLLPTFIEYIHLHFSVESVSVLVLALCMFLVIIMFKFFGLNGLYTYNSIAVITANIQALQIVESSFGNVRMALGTVIFASTFLVSDIIAEHYGKVRAHRGIWLVFWSQISFTILIFTTILYKAIPENKHVTYALELLFIPSFRILIASLVAYFLSQYFDISIFKFISHLTRHKFLWLRTIAATTISGFIDNFIFSSLAWVVLAPNPVSLYDLFYTYILSAYIARIPVNVITIPIIYLSYSLKPKEEGLRENV